MAGVSAEPAAPPPLPTVADTLVTPGLPPLDGQAAYLGLIDYGAAWRLQTELVEARHAERIPDTLLLCQHPDVITVGRRLAAQANILDPRFPVFEVERGGDATYHGPGQLVGYPILKLRPGAGPDAPHGERDLHRYLRALEAALIDLCAGLGVPAGRNPGATGVWTLPTEEAATRKLASMGIAVRRWITFHGFALNVTTELGRFRAINPCGFAASVMSSLAACGAALPGAALSVEGLLTAATERLGERLNRRFVLVPAGQLAR
jgi:lipoyl(octanoyl) transferase